MHNQGPGTMHCAGISLLVFLWYLQITALSSITFAVKKTQTQRLNTCKAEQCCSLVCPSTHSLSLGQASSRAVIEERWR